MKLKEMIWAGLLTLGMASAAFAQVKAPMTTDAAIALIRAGKFDELHERMGAQMKAAISAEQMAAAWTGLEGAYGKFKSSEPVSRSAKNAHQVEKERLFFENGNVIMTLTLDGEGDIAGLLLRPDDAPVQAPKIAADERMKELSIMFRAKNGPEIPGTLILPKDVKRPPAVVLVHGSGSHDRYATIFANRPFLDIARGLARQGVAVLVYDKRTKVHGATIDVATLTVDQETTDDANAAIQMLRYSGKVDASRLFVLGHSQGGSLTPRMLQRDPHIRGGILLSAPGRRILDLSLDQSAYMLGDQLATEAGQRQMTLARAEIAKVRDPGTDAAENALGAPVSYLRSVDEVDPVKDAASIRQPLLILQGDRDFQVTAPDWKNWEAFVAGDPQRATWKLYPGLNHLAIPATDRKGVDDYRDPRNVDPGLIKDIADWIRTH